MTTSTTAALYCRNHRRRETGLTCYKCGKPICAECARKAEISYWCKECHQSWERLQPYPKYGGSASRSAKPTWRFDWWGSLIGTALLTVGTVIGGPVGFVIGFILWRVLMSLRR